MRGNANKIELTSVDDLFSTEESRAEERMEKIQEIPIENLFPFENHPFKVLDDDAMMETVESVRQYGVLVPGIVRPMENGCYEIISGHRRCRASELAGLKTMPVIVREMDDDEAVILMVDSNLQRENILPSERAFSLRMKLEAMKHQGERRDLTSRQVGEKLQTSVKTVADQADQSQRQVQRYIRLTYLIPDILQMVDNREMALNPAYEISFLKPEEQEMLLDEMSLTQATPSLSQAQRMKHLSQEGRLDEDTVMDIMSEEKKPVQNKVTIKSDVLKNYFPKDTTPRQMEETIIRLLDQWKQNRQRKQEQEHQHSR